MRAKFRRVLIVKLSALGDVAHALPVVDYLRRAAPGAAIDWAVDRRFASLLEGHPGLRRVVPLDIRKWKATWMTAEARAEAAEAVRFLRAGAYDAAFDIQGNAKSGVVTRLSGAPLRFGFDRRGVRETPNLLFTNRKVALRPEDGHIVSKLLRVACAPFGGDVPASPGLGEIAIGAAESERAKRIVSEALPGAFPLLVVHPGTTWRTKRMDPEFWAAVLRVLRAWLPGLGVLLSWGSEEEREEALRISDLAGGITALMPRLSIREWAAVCRLCGFLLAPDTGPLHVGAAAGAKTVSVFRATGGNRNAPQGDGHRFLQAPLPCTACLKKRCDRDPECRKSIDPSSAARAMAALMESFC
ncbi:MAG: glycosyltransferase family 9 protein [Deltaproteobacteria bacterium]|nr:glycosyltransferase family 9 protein [Deltaproteobacteria bacterium]